MKKGQSAGFIRGRPFFCSWSGGKDSCLALYHAVMNGGLPKLLFTMLSEDGHSSRSHGLSRPLLEEQARQLGIPIAFRSAGWDDYESAFASALREFQADGIEVGVFGDIDIGSNRDWCLRMCRGAGIRPYHPLWKRPRRELLREFIQLQFKASIVVTNASRLGPQWLGKVIDERTLRDLERSGVDASGELGEYHTVVTGGPVFKSAIRLEEGEKVFHDGYWFLKIRFD